MLSSSVSATLRGIDGQQVHVEVHISSGLPSFHVVGMPDASCREARDRVRAAIVSSGFKWPNGSRVTVNLAPSEVRKEGSGLDLAIAMGIIAATPRSHDGESPGRLTIEAGDLEGYAFISELGLDGTLRAVPGTLSRVAAVIDHTVVVAPDAAHEATLAGARCVRVCRSLRQVAECVKGIEPWPDLPPGPAPGPRVSLPDLADVAGHPFARHALEIAAAGGHNLLLVGPPGAGKSMLARRLPGILPDLDPDVSLVVSRVHSVAGLRLAGGGLITVAPFRAPHHSVSTSALIGGGSARLRPGEISCAHGGVLFLDELGEFSRSALDAMRQPLEDGTIRISRALGSVSFPAQFCLVVAMNPCPCGLLGSVEPCRCSEQDRLRYMRRLSGPLLDRIDLRVHMQRPTPHQLLESAAGESSAVVRERVLRARARASARGLASNSAIPVRRLDELVPMTIPARAMLHGALVDGRLSARGLARVRMVARTIADLSEHDMVDESAIAGALALRARPALFETTEARHV